LQRKAAKHREWLCNFCTRPSVFIDLSGSSFIFNIFFSHTSPHSVGVIQLDGNLAEAQDKSLMHQNQQHILIFPKLKTNHSVLPGYCQVNNKASRSEELECGREAIDWPVYGVASPFMAGSSLLANREPERWRRPKRFARLPGL
jgi:hypothetical protein